MSSLTEVEFLTNDAAVLHKIVAIAEHHGGKLLPEKTSESDDWIRRGVLFTVAVPEEALESFRLCIKCTELPEPIIQPSAPDIW